MSELVEGLVLKQPARRVQSAIDASGTSLRFRILALDTYTIAERLADRDDSFSPDLTALGAALSRQLGPLVTFQYDSRVSYRFASVFDAGVHQRSFGEEDEQWVPLSQDGNPVLQAQRLRLSELATTLEYETIMNAIDLGLAQIAGDGLRWEHLHDRLSDE